MTLSNGTKLSHYEITSQIGKGCMGEQRPHNERVTSLSWTYIPPGKNGFINHTQNHHHRLDGKDQANRILSSSRLGLFLWRTL